MISIYDNHTFEAALARPIDPALGELLREKWALACSAGLQDCTHILILQAGDEEAEVQQEIGFRPTVSPIDGACYGTPGFEPYWSWLADLGDYVELTLTIGNDGFAIILVIEKADGVPRAVLDMCRTYIDGEGV